MPQKVFISYSHKDEKYRESFDEHLIMMQRNGLISTWHDRKILPGEDWKNEIDENLESAQIIIFLVSSSFLSSDYCFNVEMRRALARQKQGTARIISIIVRPCDWEDSELAEYQVVPNNAKPVTTWSNMDEAWLDVAKKVKNHLREFTAKVALQSEFSEIPGPSKEILEWLDDTAITLTHRRADKVSLKDILIVPDIELEKHDDSVDFKNASFLLKERGHYLISGEEQQGKTTFLKYMFGSLLKMGFLPIYLDATEIKSASAKQEVEKRISVQYRNLTKEEYFECDNIVLLVDNFDEIGINNKFKNKFLEELIDITDTSYVTCHSYYSLMVGEIPSLEEHQRAELLGLGNKKREELVRRWISLGVEESINDKELYSKCDDLINNINTVIKKNIVPPKPIYVLFILQMFEANTNLKLDLTSFGHCYQQLIYQSFDNAKIKKQDFDKYLNVLTELAWCIFSQQSDLNFHQVDKFFDDYCEKYLPVRSGEVLDRLIQHSVLYDNGAVIGFKYPYIFYFFVAKKIAEAYSENVEVQEKVQDLLANLHREDFANILIFITHHTKEPWVLSNIKVVLESIFPKQQQATLDKEQLLFMNDFIKSIPDLIIEQREIQKERDDRNEQLDRLERELDEDDFESAENDILAGVNRTFKGMEVAGQIIRNRHATLTRQAMEELVTVAAGAGLRFLDYFIKITDSAKNEIVSLISSQLSEHPNLSNAEIKKEAEDFYMHITYGMINSFTRKIASSIGSKEALEVYRKVDSDSGTPAFKLVRQAIELQFNKAIDIKQISSCVKDLKGNEVCLRILKEIVVQHIYLFPVDYREKQQLSEHLGISVQGQRWMDMRKIGKG